MVCTSLTSLVRPGAFRTSDVGSVGYGEGEVAMVRVPKVYCPDFHHNFHQIIGDRNRRCIDEKEKCVVTNCVSAFAVFHGLYK